MVKQINQEKVNKYVYRLRKAFGQNNKEKSKEYFSHLKYHVMTGGDPTADEQIGEKLSRINELIANITSGTTTTLEGLRAEKTRLDGEISGIRNELAAKNAELATAIRNLEASEGKRTEASAKLREALEKNTQAKQMLEALKISNQDAINALKKKQQEDIIELTQNYESGKNELRAQGDKEKNKAIDEKTREIAEKVLEIEELTQTLASKGTEIDDLRRNLQQLGEEKELEKLQLSQQLERTRAGLELIITTVKQNLGATKAMVTKLKSDNAELVRQLGESQARVTELEANIQQANELKDAAIAEKEQAVKAKGDMERATQGRVGQLDDVIRQLTTLLGLTTPPTATADANAPAATAENVAAPATTQQTVPNIADDEEYKQALTIRSVLQPLTGKNVKGANIKITNAEIVSAYEGENSKQTRDNISNLERIIASLKSKYPPENTKIFEDLIRNLRQKYESVKEKLIRQ
jgi:hypothetical protein